MENKEIRPVEDKLTRVQLVKDALAQVRERNRTAWGVTSPAYNAILFAEEVIDAALGNDPSPRISFYSGGVRSDLLEFDLAKREEK